MMAIYICIRTNQMDMGNQRRKKSEAASAGGFEKKLGWQQKGRTEQKRVTSFVFGKSSHPINRRENRKSYLEIKYRRNKRNQNFGGACPVAPA
jgi:hypothetical protein